MEDVTWFDFPESTGKSELGGRSVRNYEMIFRGTCESCVVPENETGEKQ